jgi:hypothetical protein
MRAWHEDYVFQVFSVAGILLCAATLLVGLLKALGRKV